LKKVLIITTGNFPFGGASANYLRLLSKGLIKRGLPVEILLPSGYLFGNKKNSLKTKKNVYENIEYRYLGFINHPSGLLLKIVSSFVGFICTFIFLIISTIKSDFGTIIHYNSSITNNLLLLFIRFVSRTKLIFILPELYDKPLAKSPFLTKLKWYNHFMGLKYVTKQADGLIVLSHYLKDFFIKKQHFEKLILKVPNLTDPSAFIIHQTKSFKKGVFTIGYTGTPTHKDGIYDLINGFKYFTNKYPLTHLLIIGDLTNGKSVIGDLKQYAENLNIENKITFTGLINFNKIPNLLNMCDALALARPSGRFAEAGFPTKLGEYLACKKPVVLTKVGDIKDYFKNNENAVLVSPGDIRELAKGFEFLYNNPDKAKDIGEKGYQWMLQNLEYKKVSAEIATFIDTVKSRERIH